MAGNIVLKLEDLKIGIKLPAPVFDARKKSLLLLNHGVVLTKQFVDKLRERGITSVCVDENYADEVRGLPAGTTKQATAIKVNEAKIEESPYEKKKKKQQEAPHKKHVELMPVKQTKPTKVKITEFKEKHKANTQLMHNIYDLIKNITAFSKDQIQQITLSSIEQMTEDIDIFVMQALTEHETPEEHTHALRVAELSIAAATIMKIPEEQIQLLGLGCLLSRSGFTNQARTIISANKKLNAVEMIEVKKGPSRTFDIMSKCPELHMITRQVAYQIFERWDGSGYPRGRAGVQIHPLARIAGVCDVYVALITDRPHRKGLTGYSAVQEIIKETKMGKFDPAVVRGLLQTISLFPLGTFVKLSNGHIGKVIRSIPETYDRPVLALVSTPEHEIFPLADHPEVQVVDVIEDEQELAMQIAEFWNVDIETEGNFNESELESMNVDETVEEFLDDSQTAWETNDELASLKHIQKTFSFE